MQCTPKELAVRLADRKQLEQKILDLEARNGWQQAQDCRRVSLVPVRRAWGRLAPRRRLCDCTGRLAGRKLVG